MIVVDASITLAWCLADESDEYAEQILDRVVRESAVAPAHWPLEVANGIRTAVLRGRIDPEVIPGVGQLLFGLGIEVVPVELSTALWSGLDTAQNQDLSVYDAVYLDLARVRALPLATIDAKLRAACQRADVDLAT